MNANDRFIIIEVELRADLSLAIKTHSLQKFPFIFFLVIFLFQIHVAVVNSINQIVAR